ncbi:MAG: C-GCAxxG-C-C family protein [Ignavibacteria bacterium]
MAKPESAVECFTCGFNCAQAVLSTYGPELGIDRITALKTAGPFGGGMGRMGETCGAVTGAFMTIGLKYSMTKQGEEELRNKGYELVRIFTEKFKLKHGSIKCRDLLQADIGTPEGYKLAAEKKLFRTICPGLVNDASLILEELLEL